MAHLTVFNYLHRNSVLHEMDVRIKLICMVLFSITIGFAVSAVQFGILLAIISLAMILSKLPLIRLLSELRLFAFLIFAVMAVHSVSIPGIGLEIFPWITKEGILSGFIFAGRLLLIIFLCVILTGTTSLGSLRNGVEWFLRPIPFIPETRVATMMNLTFSLIPLIFEQASEMLDAQKARCIDSGKNPVRRVRYLVLPLLLQTFDRADELIMAMESRCYSESRTQGVFCAQALDWSILLFSLLVSLGMITCQIVFG